MSGSSCTGAVGLVDRDRLVSDDDGARLDLRCAACGYGASVRIAPEECPMCRGTVWEHVRTVTAEDDR
jgi:rubrerythrin